MGAKSWAQLREWTKTTTAGDYLEEWDRASGNHDGEYDDATYAQIRRWLRARDLTIETDDRGVYVAPDRDSRRLVIEVGAIVGDDGTGDLGIIVRHALCDDPNATAEDIAEIVREARAYAALERARG